MPRFLFYLIIATPFFATEYTMDHLNLPTVYQSHVELKYFEAGHMMYLHEPELKQMKIELAGFIKVDRPNAGESAIYSLKKGTQGSAQIE